MSERSVLLQVKVEVQCEECGEDLSAWVTEDNIVVVESCLCQQEEQPVEEPEEALLSDSGSRQSPDYLRGYSDGYHAGLS